VTYFPRSCGTVIVSEAVARLPALSMAVTARQVKRGHHVRLQNAHGVVTLL